MAGTVLKKNNGEPLRDCEDNEVSIGDLVVIVPYGGYRLRKGKVNRETASSIFINDHCIRKDRCVKHCLKL